MIQNYNIQLPFYRILSSDGIDTNSNSKKIIIFHTIILSDTVCHVSDQNACKRMNNISFKHDLLSYAFRRLGLSANHWDWLHEPQDCSVAPSFTPVSLNPKTASCTLHLFDRFCASQRVMKVWRNAFCVVHTISLYVWLSLIITHYTIILISELSLYFIVGVIPSFSMTTTEIRLQRS